MVRDLRHSPFQWQEKSAMRLIREAFQEEKGNKLSFAIAVYVCMTELASNQQSDVLQFTQSELAKMTGLSRKTVNEIIERFERLNLVVKEPRRDERGFLLACQYQLLSVVTHSNSDVTVGNNVVTRSNNDVTMGNNDVTRIHNQEFEQKGQNSAKKSVPVVTHGYNDVTMGNSVVTSKIQSCVTQQIEQYIEQYKEEISEHILPQTQAFGGTGKTENAHKLILSNENLKNDSLPISDHVRSTASPCEGDTAISKLKSKSKSLAKTETPEEAEFRGAWFAFATAATTWLVAQGGVQEVPAHFWAWARKIHKTDPRITVEVMKQCFNLYVSQKGGTGWRGRTKSFKQFVAAFLDIYQFFNNNQTVQSNENYQTSNEPSTYKFRKQNERDQEWLAIAEQSSLEHLNRFTDVEDSGRNQ